MPAPTTIPAPNVAAWPVVFTLAWRELVRFFRQKNRVFGALGQPIIFWLLFGEGLRFKDLGYEFFFPGTLAMILLFTAIFSTISIIEDRKEGFLQSVLIAPCPRWTMVLGKILGGAMIAFLQGLLFLFLGTFTLENIDPSILEFAQAVALMFVVAVSLTSLGFFLAWRMNSTQGFHAVMSVLLFPMWLLSGAFFPAGDGGWVAIITKFNPLTYGVSGLRHYLHGSTENAPSITLCWTISLLFALVMFAAAWKISATRTRGDLQ